MIGEIFDIKHFAVHDGSGIRTTIFLKGCPLHCIWCHNPEGMHPGKDIWVKREACLRCETCVHACPEGAVHLTDGQIEIDKDKCSYCGVCVAKCPSRAMRRIDRHLETDEIVELVKREQLFAELSGGGITVSGGEPLMQPEFTAELLRKCQEAGIQTCIETSMFASKETVNKVLPYLDSVIMDIKLIDEEQHKKYTGVSNKTILENFRLVAASGKPMLVRTPLIPDITATEENLRGIRAFVDSVSPEIPMEVLNFNSLAGSKYQLLGETYYDDSARAFPKEVFVKYKSYVRQEG